MREVLLLCWRDSNHPQGGGSERYLERIGAQLAAQGINVTYRTAMYPGARRTEIINGMRVSRGGGRLTVYPRALLAILAGRLGYGPLKGIKPDAVIDTQNGVPFFAKLVAGAPVVVLVHHCHREQWPVAGRIMATVGWFIESTLSPWLHRRNQYLTVSLPSAEELAALGVGHDRVAVVRAGTDPLPRTVEAGSVSTRTAHPSMCALSRLVPHKRIEDAMASLAALRPSIPNLHLDVIGDGWWSDDLRAYANTLGVTDAVTFHGHVTEERKHQLLARSWVHVMPSQKEGWGIVVIEAAQHGVPTVGYRASKGLTDSVIDQVTGYLVDDHNQLTSALSTLLTNDVQRQQLGEKARSRVGDFSWKRTAHGVRTVLSAATRGERVGGLVGAEPEGTQSVS